MKIEASQIRQRLAELLDLPLDSVHLDADVHSDVGKEIDFIVRAGEYELIVEAKRNNSSVALAQVAQNLRRVVQERRGVIPLLVVPYMGETGRRLCEELGVSWLDLSGNARIKGPGLNISWTGRPNRFKYEPAAKSIFAPKISRVARWFLMNPGTPTTQRDLAGVIDLDEGYVSHAIAQMIQAGYVTRDVDKRLIVRDSEMLLGDWRQVYEFSKHRVIRGHILARSGEALVTKLTAVLGHEAQRYAFTGLAAAWQMDRFAGFRLATVYLEREPDQELLQDLGFRQEDRGANTWIVLPRDEGVFQGGSVVEGVACVHPVQVYLDLKAQPERADEAAAHLRKRIVESFAHG